VWNGEVWNGEVWSGGGEERRGEEWVGLEDKPPKPARGIDERVKDETFEG
jgi:hypothetical protein